MNQTDIDALVLRTQCRRREYVRDWYARALARWQETRSYERATHGYWRGAKMSATYQLRKATRAVDALVQP